MPPISAESQMSASTLASRIMNLLVIDDLWTAAATGTRPQQGDASLPDYAQITRRMMELIPEIGQASDFVRLIPVFMGDDGEERFTALQWGSELSAEDRDDLRWLAAREGGLGGLAHKAADVLLDYGDEVASLKGQVRSIGQGLQVEGDLSRRFRCGLGQSLIVTGAGCLPAAASAGAGAAFAAGVAATGMAVGAATGGIGAIAIMVAGLLVIRKARC
jgi:hypothetical protein